MQNLMLTWPPPIADGFGLPYFSYWEVAGPDYIIRDNKWIMESRPDSIHLSSAVIATSYAMMMYLDHGLFDEAVGMAKWLNNHRMEVQFFAGDLVSQANAVGESLKLL